MTKRFPVLFCVASLLLFTGCIQHIAISTVGGIVDDGFDALTEEQDLEFAAQALPSNLKLLEIMLKSEPEDARLLRLLAEGYNSYALGFVEDTDPERAKMFYLRATDYALRLVRQDAALAKAFDSFQVDDLKAELARRDKDDVPGIFWAAFGMGSYLNLALNNPDAIAMLPKAEAMMKFVARVDSSFYYAGADMFLGTLYGSRARILGGDPDVSRAHFERALRITGGNILITHVYFAGSYAAQTLNESLFDELLATVDRTSIDVFPKFRLGNAIAKKKAKLLQARKADLF
ncbi:MAG: TRAP transporter TatT component family protein [Bacteroidota bacterium]